MNEVYVRHFQIEPWQDDEGDHGLFYGTGKCMYMNHCFDMYEIKRITPVHTKEHRSYFWFDIVFDDDHKITLDFATRADALRAQRTLAAAYTRTGDYQRAKESERSKESDME